MLIGLVGLVVAALGCWWAYVAAKKSRESVELSKEALEVARESLGIQRMELETSPVSTNVTDDELFVLRQVEEKGPITYGVFNTGAQSISTKNIGGRPVAPVVVEPSSRFFFDALESVTRSGLLQSTAGARHELTDSGRVVLRRFRERRVERALHLG